MRDGAGRRPHGATVTSHARTLPPTLTPTLRNQATSRAATMAHLTGGMTSTTHLGALMIGEKRHGSKAIPALHRPLHGPAQPMSPMPLLRRALALSPLLPLPHRLHPQASTDTEMCEKCKRKDKNRAKACRKESQRPLRESHPQCTQPKVRAYVRRVLTRPETRAQARPTTMPTRRHTRTSHPGSVPQARHLEYRLARRHHRTTHDPLPVHHKGQRGRLVRTPLCESLVLPRGKVKTKRKRKRI